MIFGDHTVADLRAKGATLDGDMSDGGFGLVARLVVPGAGTMQLYQPRHPQALDL